MEKRIKVDAEEINRLAPLCDVGYYPPGVAHPTPWATYDKETGEMVVCNDSDPRMQCLIRTIECVGEEIELEEGITVTKEL